MLKILTIASILATSPAVADGIPPGIVRGYLTIRDRLCKTEIGSEIETQLRHQGRVLSRIDASYQEELDAGIHLAGVHYLREPKEVFCNNPKPF